MKTTVAKLIVTVIAMISVAFMPIAAFATCSQDVCNGSYPDSVKAACGCINSGSDNLPEVIVKIINRIVGALGVVALIFIFLGGVSYMTSSGDAAKTKKAKDTILYACIGLAVCALAFAITQFAINAINGANS